MMQRILTPEILDFLKPDDPRALRSRRDLALINRVMRQGAIMAKTLSALPAPQLLADLGGGDGQFLLGVARRMTKHWPAVKAVILDQQDIVSASTRAGFADLGWSCEVLQGDIFQTLPQIAPDIVTTNLFLHHLDDAALARLLALAARQAKAFVACEPRRSGFALLGARLVGILGANDVTRHDAVVSVEAGFRAHELAALWPQSGRWTLGERAVFPFTHVLRAHVL
jgi:hypothetical protein